MPRASRDAAVQCSKFKVQGSPRMVPTVPTVQSLRSVQTNPHGGLFKVQSSRFKVLARFEVQCSLRTGLYIKAERCQAFVLRYFQTSSRKMFASRFSPPPNHPARYNRGFFIKGFSSSIKQKLTSLLVLRYGSGQKRSFKKSRHRGEFHGAVHSESERLGA